jgi:hypothetical protein
MTDMDETPRKDHLWVLVIIAACALIEVWASWVTIGSMSGFPKLFAKIPTDWTLAVTTEAYWGYALYSWLAAAPGPRSRRFAMWSAGAVFLLSLTGQGSAHLVKPGTAPPAPLIVFVTALPVLVLALIAILVHLRQADREAIAEDKQAKADAERQAAIERAENDERAALRREVDALTQQLAASETARSEAEKRAAKADARITQLERKTGAQTGAKGSRKQGAGKGANAGRKTRATTDENDVDARTEALKILGAEPDISGAKLGPRVGMSARWGQLHRDELVALAAEFAGDGEGDEMAAPKDAADGGQDSQEL